MLFFKKKKKVFFRFVPKEDITAYELAKLIPFFEGIHKPTTEENLAKQLKKLPENCLRHIEVID